MFIPALMWFVSRALKLPWQVWGLVAVICVSLYALHYERATGRREGASQTLENIRENNDVAKQKADEAGAAVQNCFDGGGSWDRLAGVCNPVTRP